MQNVVGVGFKSLFFHHVFDPGNVGGFKKTVPHFVFHGIFGHGLDLANNDVVNFRFYFVCRFQRQLVSENDFNIFKIISRFRENILVFRQIIFAIFGIQVLDGFFGMSPVGGNGQIAHHGQCGFHDFAVVKRDGTQQIVGRTVVGVIGEDAFQ